MSANWWIVGEDEYEGQPLIEIAQGEIGTPEYRPICSVVADDTARCTEEDWENARKIISAPELAARCERLLEALKGVLKEADRSTVAFDRARAAIAEGEQT